MKPVIKDEMITTDVLIIGAGIGGLAAAFHTSEQGLDTLLICKGKIGGGASYFPLKATLGIQITKDQQDLSLFKQDILRVAMEMNDPALVDIYINESPQVINTLNAIGFHPWLRKDNRPACFARYARDIYLINNWEDARKQCRKIFTGKAHIQIKENSYPVKIITENNQVKGAIIFHNEQFIFVQCAAIIFASGGIAGLYQHNLYPADITGSGHSLALDAGASLVNLEFIQFIPGITTPKYKTLFGEHTLKYCLSLYDDQGNDVFSQLSALEKSALFTERSGYAPFSYDFPSHIFDTCLQSYISHGQADGIQVRFHPALYQDSSEFYVVYLRWLKQTIGIDLIEDPVKIAPFAHSCNGGIKIDADGQSQVTGLFAVGEIASAIEGANRLGGNSVGGALVFASRAAVKASQYQGMARDFTLSHARQQFSDFAAQFTAGEYTPEYCMTQTRSLMMQYAGIIRCHQGLTDAMQQIDILIARYNPLHYSFDLYYAMRTAKLLLTAMRSREESRGAHYREDFPQTLTESFRVEIALQSIMTATHSTDSGLQKNTGNNLSERADYRISKVTVSSQRSCQLKHQE